jgi:hypothetical protein
LEITISEQRLFAAISLPEGSETNVHGNPKIEIDKEIPVTEEHPMPGGRSVRLTRGKFRLQVQVVREPGRMVVPDRWQPRDGPALVGGLPGTNRRR